MGFADVELGRVVSPTRGMPGMPRKLGSRRTWILALVCLGLYALASMNMNAIQTKATSLLDRRQGAERIRKFHAQLVKEYPARGVGGRVHRNHNFAALDRLRACISFGTCRENQEKIILLGSHHFGGALEGPIDGEERVWAASTMDAFAGAGYTTLISFSTMDTLFIYQGLSDMIKLVYWEPETLKRCIQRNGTNYADIEAAEDDKGAWQLGTKACIQTADYAEGVPYWKSVVFHFWGGWGGHANPLGAPWTLAPENYAKINPGHPRGESRFVGYSVSKMCKQQTAYRPYQRKQVGAILGSGKLYFERERNKFFGLLKGVEEKISPAASDSEPFSFLTMAGDKDDTLAEQGLETIGRQAPDIWSENVARSKVMVGLGHPANSPSTYQALCYGVPFINPILSWDKENPDDRDKWETQSDALKHLNPPYVYHVHAGSPDELETAIQKAVDAPLERFIPDDMRMPDVIRRHAELAEIDWQEECRKALADMDGEQQMIGRDYCMDEPPRVKAKAQSKTQGRK